MYASIRQGKAKSGMAEELTRRIKEGAIPIISDVEGFRAYYVVYAPDDTVTAISIFNSYAGAQQFKQARAGVDRAESCASARRTSHCDGWASNCPYLGLSFVQVGDAAHDARREALVMRWRGITACAIHAGPRACYGGLMRDHDCGHSHGAERQGCQNNESHNGRIPHLARSRIRMTAPYAS